MLPVSELPLLTLLYPPILPFIGVRTFFVGNLLPYIFLKDMAILRGCLGHGGSAVSWIKLLMRPSADLFTALGL